MQQDSPERESQPLSRFSSHISRSRSLPRVSSGPVNCSNDRGRQDEPSQRVLPRHGDHAARIWASRGSCRRLKQERYALWERNCDVQGGRRRRCSLHSAKPEVLRGKKGQNNIRSDFEAVERSLQGK